MNTLTRTTAGCLVLLATAGAARAADWTTPAVLMKGCEPEPVQCTVEPAPRPVVNARGQAAVAFAYISGNHVDIRVTTATTAGRFGPAATIGSGLRPAVAITSRGVVTVVWSRRGTLNYSRGSVGKKFSKPAVLTPRGSKIGDDSANLAQQPDGSVVVVYTNGYRTRSGKYKERLRSVVLPVSGPAAPPMELGNGFIDHDSFRAGANGQLAVCCVSTAGTVPATGAATGVQAFSPANGWMRLDPGLEADQRVETVATGRGDVALGTVDIDRGGESVALGVPGVLRADSSGAFAPQLLAPVINRHRAFGPVVAIDGSGLSVLVYQEKDAPAAFSNTAPIYAVTAPAGGNFGPRRRLDASRSLHPALRPFGTGAIAAWQTAKGTWGVAIERNGVFAKATAPAGGPSMIGEDFSYNRGIATAGRYVVLTWTAKDGSVRASRGTP